MIKFKNLRVLRPWGDPFSLAEEDLSGVWKKEIIKSVIIGRQKYGVFIYKS